MSKNKCCVPMCFITIDDGVHLHRFRNPVTDADRFGAWVSRIGGEIEGMDNKSIFTNRRVCHKHFPENVIFLSNRLSKIAIPQLHLPGTHNLVTFVNQDTSCNLDAVPSTSQVPPFIDPMPSTSQALTLPRKQNSIKTVSHKISQADQAEVKKMLKKVNMNLKKKSGTKGVNFARNISKSRAFNILTNKMSKNAQQLFLMQITQSGKELKGRRFTLEQKILALALYKPSPKAYRVLRRMCVLPSRRSLQKLLHNINLSPGYNERIFKHLKKRVAKMPEKHKFCTLVFDEMAIGTSCTYNAVKDEIEGFVDDGKDRYPNFCDHVLVFIIRGVVKKYKQPVWFSYSAGATNTSALKRQILLVLRQLFEADLKVIATVCDQAITNLAALNSLMDETKRNMLKSNKEYTGGYFIAEKQRIFAIYDPPHLIKGIRNNLLSKDLQYIMGGKESLAKWEHIQQLYERSPNYKGVKIMPKLTAFHVVPHLIPKMKVKYATQVLSKSVGAALGYMAESGCMPKDSTQTADLLIFFDELFDSVNGSFHQAVGGKIYRTAVTPKSPHRNLWNRSLPVLKSMKFVTHLRGGVVPSLTSWVKTIEAFKNITLFLHKKGINSLLLRNFNQDVLENFFGSIRAHGYGNTMPSASHFVAAYKTLMLNNLTTTHAVGSNCEADDCIALESFKEFINEEEAPLICDSQINIDFDHVDIADIDTEILINNKEKENVEKCAAIGYCSGWIAVKAKKAIYKNCQVCKNEMETEDIKSFHKYIKIKEFENKRWLCYPTRCLFDFFAQVENITYMILKTTAARPKIAEYIKFAVSINVNIHFLTCKEHEAIMKEFLINKSVLFFINNWCKEVGHLLTGKTMLYDISDPFKNSARNMFLKGRGFKRRRQPNQ